MAELLKRQYDLVVLKITLLPGKSSERRNAPTQTGSSARVRFELQKRERGEIVGSAPYEAAARDMGIPRHLDWESLRGRGHYPFALPRGFPEWLAEQVDDLGSRPLWLHLVKPYGYLGMFPWEHLLREVTSSPVLRLPDFVVDAPQQTPSALDVALCCCPGPTDDLSAGAAFILKAAEAIASNGTRPVRVAIFAGRALHDRLTQAERAKDVSLHLVELETTSTLAAFVDAVVTATNAITNPIRDWLRSHVGATTKTGLPSSADLISNATDPVTSPWLLAMRAALGARSVDAIHVVAHAMLSLERGALLLDQESAEKSSVSSHTVLAPELLALQTQVGAWAAGFTSLPTCFSDMALRQFADDLGQLRPGPLLYHDAAADPQCEALAAAYRFLLSDRPVPAPAAQGFFAYCEPFRVLDEVQPEATLQAQSRRYAEKVPLPDIHEGVSSIFRATDNVPSWVAASERFVDMYKMRLAELSSQIEGTPVAKLDEIRSTLTRLQSTIAKVAGDKLS